MAPSTRGAAAKAASTGFLNRHQNVYLYVPNLIGKLGLEILRRCLSNIYSCSDLIDIAGLCSGSILA